MLEILQNIYSDSRIIGTIGLGFDIIGAWLVGWEVVNNFEGAKLRRHKVASRPGTERAREIASKHFRGSKKSKVNKTPIETEEYKRHQRRSRSFMLLGLGFLTIGFVLQIWSLWIDDLTVKTIVT